MMVTASYLPSSFSVKFLDSNTKLTFTKASDSEISVSLRLSSSPESYE